MKTFYQFDPSGYLISEVLCQESPLEPGKYLIPEKCTDVIPSNFGTPRVANETKPKSLGVNFFIKF